MVLFHRRMNDYSSSKVKAGLAEFAEIGRLVISSPVNLPLQLLSALFFKPKGFLFWQKGIAGPCSSRLSPKSGHKRQAVGGDAALPNP